MIYGELTKLSDANEQERTDVRMITNKNTQTKIHVSTHALDYTWHKSSLLLSVENVFAMFTCDDRSSELSWS